jgi:hypothetical protein
MAKNTFVCIEWGEGVNMYCNLPEVTQQLGVNIILHHGGGLAYFISTLPYSGIFIYIDF